jgi:phosphatidylethanolamine/phosphatidyl-N-methylethanolamine N-methyltransferase
MEPPPLTPPGLSANVPVLPEGERMTRAIANSVYDLYGRFYDRFELLFKRRLERAITALPLHSGDRILDVGIGTGLSLEFYPSYVHVTGIDLSAGMLQQAQRKLDDGLVRVDAPRTDTQLVQGDALNLPFADASFDAVFLSHVVTTVPDPQRCLAEAFRVARNHAHIVMVNHFRSPYPVLSWLETAIDPFCRKLGWRCDLSLTDLLTRAGVEEPQRMERTHGQIFRIVYLQKTRDIVRLVPVPERAVREPKLETA